MTTTLADATLELAKILTDVVESVATGGSTTTLVDTALGEPDDQYSDDYFTNGVLWPISGSLDGYMFEINDWDAATHTFTFDAAAGGLSIGANDKYLVCPKRYPLYRLVQAINQATQSFGRIPTTDETTLTVDEQHAYTLPSGVYNVLRVEIASYTTGEEYWEPNYNWREVGGELLFDTDFEPIEDDLPIKLTYLTEHTQFDISQYSGTINQYIKMERLIWNAAVHFLRWRVQQTREDRPDLTGRLNEAILMASIMDQRYPIIINLNRRDIHMASW